MTLPHIAHWLVPFGVDGMRCTYHRKMFLKEHMPVLRLVGGELVLVCPECVKVHESVVKAKKVSTLERCTACNELVTFTCYKCQVGWCEAHRAETLSRENLCRLCAATGGEWYGRDY